MPLDQGMEQRLPAHYYTITICDYGHQIQQLTVSGSGLYAPSIGPFHKPSWTKLQIWQYSLVSPDLVLRISPTLLCSTPPLPLAELAKNAACILINSRLTRVPLSSSDPLEIIQTIPRNSPHFITTPGSGRHGKAQGTLTGLIIYSSLWQTVYATPSELYTAPCNLELNVFQPLASLD